MVIGRRTDDSALLVMLDTETAYGKDITPEAAGRVR
jgi:hypothetical protein